MVERIEKPFYSPEEFRHILGCGKSVCYTALKEGKIRSFRLGNRYFIPDTEVDRLKNSAIAESGDVLKADPDPW